MIFKQKKQYHSLNPQPLHLCGSLHLRVKQIRQKCKDFLYQAIDSK